ncbi:MAG: hypothetical protein QOJ53_1355 [Sphingomonadales bacterium]|jgi:uncharacterized membrane protein|nr:hypothetical protein [Sphingomonadales bacterium]MEA3042794.1 hypothetical protein [Sphingomonadales bacterium]MEA3047023.1 hypothetical protein [Sphingomonadales bacterium]
MKRTLGNKFLAFIAVLIAVALAAGWIVRELTDDTLRDAAVKGFMIGFDLAAFLFLLASVHLLRVGDPAVMREHAAANDANRTTLLLVTVAISAAILGAVAMETMAAGGPGTKTKILVVATLFTAWLFANTIYALHYAHLFYGSEAGIDFPGKEPPGYADFVYFAFTLGMTFQTSDVEISDRGIRNVVTLHCLVAFVFNLGILAFTINVLGG